MSTLTKTGARAWWPTIAIMGVSAGIWAAASVERPAPKVPETQPAAASIVVLGFNNLGMHCMNQSFGNLCILPPYNTLHAQVILRGDEPQILTSGVTVSYWIPNNTVSSNKTDFWRYAPQLFGVNLPLDIGLTGNGMAGIMVPGGNLDWVATGVPITPLNDLFQLQPYNVANIQAFTAGLTARTVAVMPVSWEISCNMCHGKQLSRNSLQTAEFPYSTDIDILTKHDRMHGTDLLHQRPVLCASCHADPALGTGGVLGVPTMSSAMHSSHASRVESLTGLPNKCYACHPGVKTQCQRDIHITNGVTCTNCHGGMAAVGDPNRRPWQDEPRCGTCHAVSGHEYEQPGVLYQASQGHGGVLCASCHNSPHAITPTTNPEDNQQAILQQGYPGVINKCTVCHTSQPSEAFFHKRFD